MQKRTKIENEMEMIENNLAQKDDVRPELLVRDCLQANPAASPAYVVLWLRNYGEEMSVEAAGAMLAAIKTG